MIPIDNVEKGKGRGDERRWSPTGSNERGEEGMGVGVKGGGAVEWVGVVGEGV